MDKNTTQSSKPDEQMMDILLVFDKEEKTLKAVSKIDETGKMETVPAKKENQSEFLKIDKHKDLLENFLSNFIRQVKNPTRLEFFKVPVIRLEPLAKLFQKNIENPTPSGTKEMEKYQIKTPEIMEQKQKEENPQQQKQSYYHNPEKIDWEGLKNLGVTKEQLEKNNVLETMLKGNKSPQLFSISMNLGNAVVKFDAKLSFQNKPDGSVALAVHGIRQEPELEKPFFCHKFSEEDKKNLLSTGNMGRLAETTNYKTQETSPSYISIDRQTNEIVAVKAENIRLPEEIKGVKLSEEQKLALHEGKAVYLENMLSKAGKEFSAHIQVNAEKRGIEFLFDKQPKQSQEQKQDKTAEQSQSKEIKQDADGKKIFIPQKIGGQEVSMKQQNELRTGKTVYLEGLIDKKGESYNAYVKLNPETKKLNFHSKNPDNVQQVTPDNQHKTQVAANNEGKKTEENKHVNEPLKQGQNKPTEKQAEKQEQKQESEQKQSQPKKSKGMKM